MEENTFHSDLEKESFLFQVSEKESGIDQEGFNKIRQYEQGSLKEKIVTIQFIKNTFF